MNKGFAPMWWMKRVFNDYLERYTGMHMMNSIPRGSTKFAREYFKGKELSCIEVGVYKGYNAKNIMKMLHVKEFYLVDPYKDYSEYQEEVTAWLGKAREYARKTLSIFASKRRVRLYFIYEEADQAVDLIKLWKKEQFDFIYIDGNHAEKYVYQDITNYWDLVKKGGILAGHDFNLEGVQRAVVLFADKNGLKISNLGVDWWFVK